MTVGATGGSQAAWRAERSAQIALRAGAVASIDQQQRMSRPGTGQQASRAGDRRSRSGKAPTAPTSEHQTWTDLLAHLRQVTPSVRPGSGWLKVLAQTLARASDPRSPAVERARLLAAFSVQLDYLFMMRVARSREATAGTGPSRIEVSPDRGLLDERLQELSAEHDRLLHDDVLPALAGEGVHFPAWDDLHDHDKAQLRALFRDVIHPLVTPLAVDTTHPFPHICALSLNLGVVLRDRRSGVERFACVQIPTRLPGFVRLDARRLVGIDTLVSASLGELFRGLQVLERSSFRVTHNVEIESDCGDESPSFEETAIARRHRDVPVRLEIDDTTSQRMLEILVRNLNVAAGDVYRVRPPLGMAATMLAVTADHSNHPAAATSRAPRDRLERAWSPAAPLSAARPGSQRPTPLSRSGTASQRAFLEQATSNPAVFMIVQTLGGRGADPAVVDALIAAVAAGKHVVVLLDGGTWDRKPIRSKLSRKLVRAGCQVAHGPAGIRGPGALGLALRAAGARGVRGYAHLGTPGFYPWPEGDPSDMGLVSTDPHACSEVAHLLLRLCESSPHEARSDRAVRRSEAAAVRSAAEA